MIFSCFCLQGIFVYIFRELLRYSTRFVSQSVYCSLQLQSTTDSTKLFLSFWAGNVYNHLLLAEIAPSLLAAKRVLEITGCFLAIPTKSPVIFSLLGFDARSVKTLNSELNQIPPACVVPTFNYGDLYKVLAGPAVKILDRYDLHSVLQILLMKLRTAVGSTWLNNLPEVRQVSSCVVCHHYSSVVPGSFNF